MKFCGGMIYLIQSDLHYGPCPLACGLGSRIPGLVSTSSTPTKSEDIITTRRFHQMARTCRGTIILKLPFSWGSFAFVRRRGKSKWSLSVADFLAYFVVTRYANRRLKGRNALLLSSPMPKLRGNHISRCFRFDFSFFFPFPFFFPLFSLSISLFLLNSLSVSS